MPLARRQEIAEIVRRHDAYLLEDDAYAICCRRLSPRSRA